MGLYYSDEIFAIVVKTPKQGDFVFEARDIKDEYGSIDIDMNNTRFLDFIIDRVGLEWGITAVQRMMTCTIDHPPTQHLVWRKD